MMSTRVTRVDLIDILGNNAVPFVAWLNTNDPQAAIIKDFMQLTDKIDLEHPIFQNTIIPLLESKGLIDTFTKDRIKNMINRSYARHTFI